MEIALRPAITAPCSRWAFPVAGYLSYVVLFLAGFLSGQSAFNIGGFALMLAPSGGFSAASVNYGTAGKDVYTESFLDGACPIVGSYGAKDRANRGTAERLDKVLTVAGVDHDIKTYPDAGHAFLNDHDSADSPAIFAVLGRLSASEFHEPSAIDARRRIVAFFDLHLKS